MRSWAAVLAGAVVLVASYLPGFGWGEAAGALVVAGAMGLIVARSRAAGPALVVMVAGLYFVVSYGVNIPEGVVFDVIPAKMAPTLLVRSLLAGLVAAAVVVWVAGRLRQGTSAPSAAAPIDTAWGLFWRLAATVAVFMACYFVAGALIYPFVKSYYAGRAMPQPTVMVAMQVLRSLALLGAAYPLLRTFASRRDAVLVLGVVLPLFGAVAPMLPSNTIMPPSIRLVHTLETAPYLALFGVLLAIWFGPPRRRAEAVRIVEPVTA
jgi:hypothetical protein